MFFLGKKGNLKISKFWLDNFITWVKILNKDSSKQPVLNYKEQALAMKLSITKINSSKGLKTAILLGSYQTPLLLVAIKRNLLKKFIILSKKRNLFSFGLTILLILITQTFFAKKFSMECIFKVITTETR